MFWFLYPWLWRGVCNICADSLGFWIVVKLEFLQIMLGFEDWLTCWGLRCFVEYVLLRRCFDDLGSFGCSPWVDGIIPKLLLLSLLVLVFSHNIQQHRTWVVVRGSF